MRIFSKASTIFESFHHHARTPLSNSALIAGYIILWLKKCVIPSILKEALAVGMVYLAVLLAHGRPLVLLPGMVYGIQSGLGFLTEQFCHVKATEGCD